MRLIAPNYLKPFVKRQMNDVADAEAVVEAARWAQTMPGVGPITALAIETSAPDLNCFRRGRDFAAWLGLVPKQNSTGGKPSLGKTSNPLGTMLRMTLTGNGWVNATFAGC